MKVAPSAFQFLILKPAIQNVEQIMKKYADLHHPLVLTHYMDHPLGQSIASWWAYWAKANFGSRVIECGLQSRGVFEDNEFSIKLNQSNSPKFIPPKGLGWGFDDLLCELKWTQL